MTDLTQSNWYDAETHRVDFLGHTEPRRNDEMQEYLKRGGRLSDYAREMAAASAQDNSIRSRTVVAIGNDAALCTHPRDPNVRFDRALGLTPQMEKAEAAQ